LASRNRVNEVIQTAESGVGPDVTPRDHRLWTILSLENFNVPMSAADGYVTVVPDVVV
jgi:hypothetical protein